MCFTSDPFYRISEHELLQAIKHHHPSPYPCQYNLYFYYLYLWVLGLFALIGLHKIP